MSEEKHNDYTEDGEIEIDLRRLLNVFRKWSKLIIVMTLLCAFAAGIVSAFILPPVYQANTLLMVAQATDKLQSQPTAANTGDDLDQVVNTISRLPVLTMNTYLGQLQSEALMKRVIKKLDLDEEGITPADLSTMIEAEVVQDSNLIQVKVNNNDPELAARIANTLTEEYLQLMTDKNKEQMSRSVTFLDEQQAKNNKSLEKAEQALKDYQSQPRGVAVLQAEFTKKSTDLADLTSRQSLAQVELRQLTSGVNQIQAELSVTSNMVTVDNYNPNTGSIVKGQEVNPVYVNLAQQLGEKKAALAEKQGEVQGLNTMVSAMSAELDALQAELAQKTIDQDKLQREVDRLKKTSETLAQKGTETQIAKSIDLGDTSVTVVSEASIPGEPVKPNKKLNVAIAAVLGLVIFTLLAFVLEYLDNTIKTPEDVAREVELPVLGLIPKAEPNSTP